jgi:hypothetical protein
MVAKISEKSSLSFIQTGILVGIKDRTNEAQITDLGRYLDKVKYKWFNKVNDL